MGHLSILGPFRAILVPSWAVLSILGLFGPFRAVLVPSWAVLAFLGLSWGLGASWRHLGPSRDHPFLFFVDNFQETNLGRPFSLAILWPSVFEKVVFVRGVGAFALRRLSKTASGGSTRFLTSAWRDPKRHSKLDSIFRAFGQISMPFCASSGRRTMAEARKRERCGKGIGGGNANKQSYQKKFWGV